MSVDEGGNVKMTNPMDAGNGMADEVVTAVPAGSKLRFAALQGAPARIVQCAELQLQTKLSAWEAGERAFSGPPCECLS
jgi:hypothetical protein